ncbi:MAG: oligosaccharide flippase family protein [Flavisolibacter sp.]
MIVALRNLLRNSVVYGLANSIQKLVPVFILPIITTHLGKTALKLYDLSFIYVYLFSALILCGLDVSASTFFFDRKKQKFDQKQVLSYAFVLQLALIALNFLVFYPFRTVIASFIFSGDTSIEHFWLLAMTIVPGYMMLNYGLSVLLWLDRKKPYFIVCILNTVLNLAIAIIAIKFYRGSIKDIFFAQIGSITLCGLLAMYFIRDRLSFGTGSINTALVSRLLWFGLPFALTAFFRQLIPSVDRYFLLHYHYNEELPQYILAVKIASFFSVATNAFILVFTPYSLNKLNHDDAEKEISDLFHFISILTFICVPLVLLFKDDLVRIFADSSYHLSARLLPFLLFGWVFDLFAYFSMLGIYKSQNSTTILTILVCGTAIISGLNVLLVPLYGVFGAAISFAVTKFLIFFISLFYLKRYFRIDIRYISFFVIFFVVAAYSYLAFILSLYAYLFCLALLFILVALYIRRNFKGQGLWQLFQIKAA